MENKTSVASLPASLSLGPVTLAVADAARSLRFYRDLLGLQVLHEDTGRVVLGAGGVSLLELLVQPGASPRPANTSGLYHVAILLPDRVALAYVLNRLVTTQFPFGASDHQVSEALYLTDPDGNGLEIYRDRPRDTWHWRNGQVQMVIDPLDGAGILAELDRNPTPWQGMPAGTRIGHIHLQVSDLRAAEAFYHGALGFDVMQRMPGALFLSAGGYHHHLGLNIWNSAGAQPAPATAAGLRQFVIYLPDEAALQAVHKRVETAGYLARTDNATLLVDDPWGTVLRFEAQVT